MEPQLPKPQFSPEVAPNLQPAPPVGGEVFRGQPSPEAPAVIEQGREQRETLQDGPGGDPAAVVATPPPMPVIDPTPGAPAGSHDDASAGPAAASDDDLIEKEWVEKAKKVVSENRNDPHAQDIAVGRLQADYLKKRYGKVIALPSDR